MAGETEDTTLSDAEIAFATSLRAFRSERGWTQTDLTNELQAHGLPGMTQSTVSRIEKLARPVQLGEALAIAQLFGRPLREFLYPGPPSPLIDEAEAFASHAGRQIQEWRSSVDRTMEAALGAEYRLGVLERTHGDGLQLASPLRRRLETVRAQLLEVQRDRVFEIFEAAKQEAERDPTPAPVTHGSWVMTAATAAEGPVSEGDPVFHPGVWTATTGFGLGAALRSIAVEEETTDGEHQEAPER